MSGFPYSDTNKRYHTFDCELRRRFGRKVVKLSLDAGFTCPNIDGSRGRGGCSYCAGKGGSAPLPITEQLRRQRALLSGKWPDALSIAYFQSGSNTYTAPERLDALFSEALSFEGVVGLSVATRADCLPAEILECLSHWNERTMLTVELGLQTASDETARRINRCHTWADFLRGYGALKEQGIAVCVHLIDGLPGEDFGQMRRSAAAVAALRPDALKLHLLHVLRGTRIAMEYARGDFSLLTREEYVNIVCDQLELTPAQTVIQRLTGDGDRSLLIGPQWSRDKRSVLNEIDRELARRGAFQGSRFV